VTQNKLEGSWYFLSFPEQFSPKGISRGRQSKVVLQWGEESSVALSSSTVTQVEERVGEHNI
jgi:hypothetical protein